MNKSSLLKKMGIVLIMASLLAGCGGNSGAPAKGNAPAKGSATAQKATKWPTKPVTIVVPWNAGGDTDIYCRLIAKRLSDKFKQSFVVVDMNGGSGIVGAKTVMAAKPDGYNALFNHTGTSAIQQATKTVDFSYIDNFETCATVVQDNTYVMVVKKSAGWKDLKEFVAYAKANPGKVRYSQVYGTITHYVGARLEDTAGIKFNMLDVGAGTSERLAAFMGDQVDVLAANYLNVRDYVEKGDFLVLGVCAEKRVPGLDKVPTFKEQGYDITYPKSYEVKFPKGTDKAIVEKMTGALKEITQDPTFKKEIEKYYAEPFYRDAEQTVKEDSALIDTMKKIFVINK